MQLTNKFKQMMSKAVQQNQWSLKGKVDDHVDQLIRQIIIDHMDQRQKVTNQKQKSLDLEVFTRLEQTSHQPSIYANSLAKSPNQLVNFKTG